MGGGNTGGGGGGGTAWEGSHTCAQGPAGAVSPRSAPLPGEAAPPPPHPHGIHLNNALVGQVQRFRHDARPQVVLVVKIVNPAQRSGGPCMLPRAVHCERPTAQRQRNAASLAPVNLPLKQCQRIHTRRGDGASAWAVQRPLGAPNPHSNETKGATSSSGTALGHAPQQRLPQLYPQLSWHCNGAIRSKERGCQCGHTHSRR